MKEKSGIARFLREHGNSAPSSFHMPGHKGQAFFAEQGYGEVFARMADWDITEIPGADNLFQPEGVIRETMDKYRALYETEESYLLINGSSAGLIAAIMTAVPAGGKLIMARNCHKSIFNGLVLAGGEPVYAYPEMIEEYGISGPVTLAEIRRCLREHPDSDAVILPSPNYYGICSDIAAIAEEVHRAGKILIVDQAHGAHLKFFDAYIHAEKFAAENLGADIVVGSVHKTLASFTQSGVVNLCSDRIDRYAFADKLQLIESTSPSYLLMASLDINADLLQEKGARLIHLWEENLRYFYRQAAEIPGLRVVEHPMLDHTKINLDMSAYGLDGLALEERLMKRGIFAELVTGNLLMCMTGIGNKRYDYERLIEALGEIASCETLQQEQRQTPPVLTAQRWKQQPLPGETERVLLSEAAGRVCGSSMIPYPPGIPIVCPGEVIEEQVLDYVASLREKGEKVIGIDDRGRVSVGKV